MPILQKWKNEVKQEDMTYLHKEKRQRQPDLGEEGGVSKGLTQGNG